MEKRSIGKRGQSTTETIVLFPVYFFMVFVCLQIGQLGVALIVADYAASSIARQIVKDGIKPSGDVSGQYETRFRRLMTAGMKNGKVLANAENGLLSNVTVHTCAQVSAFPFVGTMTKGALRNSQSKCGTGGPIYFSDLPAYFGVQGKAVARMNYTPNAVELRVRID